QKAFLATLHEGTAVGLVADLLKQVDESFARVDAACEEIQKRTRRSFSNQEQGNQGHRNWTELRIRQPELVTDNVTLPIQRLREAVSDLIKLSEDKDIGQELIECNRRLAELREEVAMFLSQSAEDHVYWVERTGRTQKNLA